MCMCERVLPYIAHILSPEQYFILFTALLIIIEISARFKRFVKIFDPDSNTNGHSTATSRYYYAVTACESHAKNIIRQETAKSAEPTLPPKAIFPQ